MLNDKYKMHNWTKEELIMYEERERAATDLQSTRLAEITEAKEKGQAEGEKKGKAKVVRHP